MKKFVYIITAALIAFTGCAETRINAEETAPVFSETEIHTEKKKTAEAPPKEIKPLSASRKQSYFENENFSVIAELKNLQSSLYYPDIIHDMGYNPDMFVIEARVKVKNIGHEDMDFDFSKIGLKHGDTAMYLYYSDPEEMKNIRSEKTVVIILRFLCSVEQAAEISGFEYDGEPFSDGKNFIPENFAEVIEKQSADDVMEYLYRRYVIHRNGNYAYYTGVPTTYEFKLPKIVKDGDKEYLALKFDAYNRSDYAQLIDPKGFRLCMSEEEAGDKHWYEPLYISADENLMYAPEEAELMFKGVGKLYEMPEFLCMVPEGATKFTLIFDAGKDKIYRSAFFENTHEDAPYFSAAGNVEGEYIFYDINIEDLE